ncbi:recombinase family protein, partial [Bacillus paranthracis]|nr:recombinase family protein [Bacillus paranthracis]
MTINNVAIYLRKSRAEDGLTDAESLENHRNVLTGIAERNSWKYEIFEEIGSSMSISERPQLKILLDSVTNKYIYDAVLVMDVDRLSRDRYDSSLIMKILRDNDVKIVTADGKITNLRDENDALMT